MNSRRVGSPSRCSLKASASAWFALLAACLLPAPALSATPPAFGDCSRAAAQRVIPKSTFAQVVLRELPDYYARSDVNNPILQFCRDLTGDGTDEFVVMVNLAMSPSATPWAIFQSDPSGQVRLAFHATLDEYRYGRLDVQESGGRVWIRERTQRRRREDANCCPTGPQRTRYVDWDGRFVIRSRPPPKRQTTFGGRWTCDQAPIVGAGVELWPQHARELGERPADAGKTDATGRFRLSGPANDAPHVVRLVLRDPGRVNVELFPGPGTWRTETVAAAAVGGRVDLGQSSSSLTGAGSPCAVFSAMRVVRSGWERDVGRRSPTGETLVLWGAPTSGVPYAANTVIQWPTGYAPGDPADPKAASHEFAHTVRHAYDGTRQHFLYDAGRFLYPRPHEACDDTGAGFAFNEGWAEYWAREFTSSGPCVPFDDYAREGNVAAALTRLQEHCRVDRAAMVDVLRRHPATNDGGGIHSYEDFEKRLDCQASNPRVSKRHVQELQRRNPGRLTSSFADTAQILSQCERLLRRASLELKTCRREPVFVSGDEVGVRSATLHDADALRVRPAWVRLQYIPKAQRAAPGWKRGQPICKRTPPAQDCDEFPYLSTAQGGPGKDVSFRNMPFDENRRQGGLLNARVYERCGLSHPDAAQKHFLVVPAPRGSAIETEGLCNGHSRPQKPPGAAAAAP